MKIACAALCVQAVGAFVAPSLTKNGGLYCDGLSVIDSVHEGADMHALPPRVPVGTQLHE